MEMPGFHAAGDQSAAWFDRSGSKGDYCLTANLLMMCSMNGLNSPILEQLNDLVDFGTTQTGFFIPYSAVTGMHDCDTVFLQPVQLFLHSFIGCRITVTAVAVKKGYQLIFFCIASKCSIPSIPCFQAAGTGAAVADIHAPQNRNLFHELFKCIRIQDLCHSLIGFLITVVGLIVEQALIQINDTLLNSVQTFPNSITANDLH